MAKYEVKLNYKLRVLKHEGRESERERRKKKIKSIDNRNLQPFQTEAWLHKAYNSSIRMEEWMVIKIL